MNGTPLHANLGRPLYIFLLFLAATAATPVIQAQPALRSAADEWRSLQTSIALTPNESARTRKTAAQLAEERSQQAERLFQAAQQARDFYLGHPGDANAAKARKLEATALLESARLGRAATEPAALALASAYRKDRSQLREARFEVALAADQLELGRRLGGKRPHEKPGDYEKLADNLRKEFGDIPEVYGLYTGIASTADLETANRMATRILEMRPPPFAKAAAQAITARYGLIGRPLALRLTSVDGRTFELPASPVATGPTVLYVWTPPAQGTQSPFAPLSAPRENFGKDVRWIFLGLGATSAVANAVKAKAPYAGTHCIDATGPKSSVAQRLKARSLPAVYVFNRHGVLTGIGQARDLPALLAAANR